MATQALEVKTAILGSQPAGVSILSNIANTAALIAIETALLSTGTTAQLADGSLYRFNREGTAGLSPTSGGGKWIPISNPIPDGKVFVYGGDSLTVDNDGLHWPSIFEDLAYGSKGTGHNTAVSGRTLAQVIAGYDTEVKIYRPAVSPSSEAWFLLWIGANDFATANPSLWLTDWKALLAQARTDGFKIAVFTVLKRADVAESVDWVRTAMNDGIRFARDYYDALIDTDSLFDPSNVSSLSYHDGVHLNSAGQKQLGYLVNDGLTAGFYHYADNSKQSPLFKQKIVVNGGTLNSGIIIADCDPTGLFNPRVTFYRYSGVAGQYFATRLGLNDVSTFSIENAGSAAIGAHVFTSRFAVTYNGVLSINGATITYGANDSGGAGFKVMRIPN